MRLLPSIVPVCPQPCAALASEADRTRQDPPISVEHFPCILREFTGEVRKFTRRTLGKLPLGRLASRLEDVCRGVRRPGANQVREALVRDEQLLDDVLQDVAIVLWKRVAAGRIPAARPVIYRFLEQTTWRVARRQALRTAMLHLVAAPSDEDAAWVDVPVPANQNAIELDLSESAPRYRVLLAIHPAAIATLPPAEREAMLLWTQGASIQDVAMAIQRPDVTTRVRLHRARKRIDAFVADELQRAA